MLVVTVELWRFGNPKDRRVLGQALIANDGTGTATRGNYTARFFGKRHKEIGNAAIVKAFPRKRLLAWDLVFRALRPVFSPRNREAINDRERFAENILADLHDGKVAVELLRSQAGLYFERFGK